MRGRTNHQSCARRPQDAEEATRTSEPRPFRHLHLNSSDALDCNPHHSLFPIQVVRPRLPVLHPAHRTSTLHTAPSPTFLLALHAPHAQLPSPYPKLHPHEPRHHQCFLTNSFQHATSRVPAATSHCRQATQQSPPSHRPQATESSVRHTRLRRGHLNEGC